MEPNAQMRDILLERYGADIAQAKIFYSTQNYAFLFPEKPYMIRVSITPQKSRREILSELLWVDDLKSLAATICEPSPSLCGNLLEEFEVENTLYRAAMFRTARGSVQQTTQMTPMFFLCVGELLGKIHKVSTEEQELGMRFVRRELSENFRQRLDRCAGSIPAGILENIRRMEDAVDALPRTTGQYGLCHGDFHLNNFFVEHNNIWLFDFDSCCYTHYLYDVASFLQACLLFGYRAGEDTRKIVYEDILPWFRTGYEMNHRLEDSAWAQLETFLAYRTAYSYLSLVDIDQCGVTEDLQKIKQFFSFVLSRENVMDGMTQIRNKAH